MNWLRSHYSSIRNVCIGILCVAVVLFGWYGYGRYRDRKAEEKAMAAKQEQWEERLNSETDGYAHEILTQQSYPDFSDMEEWARLYNMGLYQKAAWIDNEDGTVTYNGKTYRRNNYIKAILCMGVDRSDEMVGTREFGSAGRSDALFLIAEDTAHNELKILNIPRDSMTEFHMDDDGNIITDVIDHVNLAFAYGDGNVDSCERCVKAVSDMLCGLRIDHYMAADTAVIAVCNDAVDGVTVTVPTEGMEKKDPAFIKGEKVTLHGSQAEAFVRYRDTMVDHSALYRMDQMREYITQYFEALKKKSKEDSLIVSHIYDEVQNYLITDMDKAEILRMAMDTMSGSGFDADSFITLPGSGIVGEVYDEYYINYGQAIPVILNLFYREVD